MKLDSLNLDLIIRVHKSLLTFDNFQCLIPLIAREAGASEFETKKSLFLLNQLDYVKDLKISGNAFSVSMIKNEEIDADLLVHEQDFILISNIDEKSLNGDIRREIEAEKEEIAFLKKKLEEAKRDLRCYKLYGKSFKEKIENAIMYHGDGTKI